MPSHKHLHARQAHHHWNEFVQGVESVANDLNPFKDAPHTLQERAPETVYKTVYKTMSQTFDGPIAGYTTVGVPAESTKDAQTDGKVTAAEFTAARVTSADDETAASPKETSLAHKPDTNKAQASDDLSESLPESIKPTKSVNLHNDSTLAVAGTTSLSHDTGFTATASVTDSLSATDAAASSTTTSTPESGSDSSPAVKAGIAIGVLGGLLLVGLLIFFLFNKRRKQLEQQKAQDDEKVNGPLPGGRPASILSTRTSATAPQLSLRPLTQFNPTFNERRSSKGAGLMLATAGASPQSATHEKGASLWERPSTAHNNNPENPFSDTARAQSPTGSAPSAANEPPTNPFDSPENIVGMAQTTDLPATSESSTTTSGAAVAGTVAVAAAAAGAAAVSTSTSLTRKQSTRKQAPEPLDLTMPIAPPSPTGTEYSMNSVPAGQSPGPSKSAAAIAEAGGPPATAVHRVQLDFKPSLDDELGLQAGQLVRILHEYDDGWALCIRLDRSKQGVAPRTCLSTRPVKPRPGPPGSRPGPPVNPSMPRGPPRGPGPNYPPGPPHGRPESPMRPMNGRPQSPAQMRPYSPAGGRPQSPAQMRPYSPAGGRPMSPYTARPASPSGGPPRSPGPRPQSPGQGPRQQRPQSPNGMNRRHSPPGLSPMNPNNNTQYRGPPGPPPQEQGDRKPVPGQAY
ncbi:hypothetical protein F4808DRAFT_311562 [Astrocystis sublimbata]|nr:hypothetical protein F4808DRAFT_311562 [Astrocystis sublimbata]